MIHKDRQIVVGLQAGVGYLCQVKCQLPGGSWADILFTFRNNLIHLWNTSEYFFSLIEFGNLNFKVFDIVDDLFF